MNDRDLALLRPKPTMHCISYPRCERCFEKEGVIVPNPEGHRHCSRCSAQMPIGEAREPESIVFRTPFWARISYWCADRLVQFHDWFKGEQQK